MVGPSKKSLLLPSRVWVSELLDFRFYFRKFLISFWWGNRIALSLWSWAGLSERNAMSANRALWQSFWIQNTSLKMNIFPWLHTKCPQPKRYVWAAPYVRILTEKALLIITGLVQRPLKLIERCDTVPEQP